MKKEVENIEQFVRADEEKISRLVGGLKRVEAPANFERRVMSRVAEGQQRSNSLFSVPAIALAAGAVIVMVVASIVFYNGGRPAVRGNEVVQDPVAVEARQSAQIVEQPVEPRQSPDPEQIAQNDREPTQPITAPYRDRTKQIRPVTNSNVGGGSITTGLNEAKPIYPQGLRPNPPRTNVDPREIMSGFKVRVKDILEMSGISAEYKNGWLVRSVTKNSVAERSGVKAGDVITAINEKKLSADGNLSTAGSVGSLTVDRGGESIVVKIK